MRSMVVYGQRTAVRDVALTVIAQQSAAYKDSQHVRERGPNTIPYPFYSEIKHITFIGCMHLANALIHTRMSTVHA